MSDIFAGMILVFLNINLDIGNMRVGLIPDFFGYYFMLKGLEEVAGYSERFGKIIPVVKGMVVYSVIVYAFALFGGATSVDLQYLYTPAGLGMLVMGIIATALSIFVSYNIVMGIKDIELAWGQDLDTVRLYSTWKVLVVFTGITHFTLILHIAPFAVVSMVVGFIVQIFYLVAFNRTRKLYYVHKT